MGLTVASYSADIIVLNWHDVDTYDKVLLAWGPGSKESDPATNQIDLSSASAIVAGYPVNSCTITGIDTSAGKSYVFKVKGGKKSDVLSAGVTWDYSDWDTIVWRVPEAGSFGGATDVTPLGPVILFGIPGMGTSLGQHTGAGNLLWYMHLGAGDGTHRWKQSNVPLGNIGNCNQAFPGGQGVIYTITDDARLHWYKLPGSSDGTPGLVHAPDPKGYIGEGWNFKHVFSGGNGIIYAVNDAGNLLWYRHLGFVDGTDTWQTTPDPKGFIGEGWNFKHVFSGGNGIIYAVNHAGNLLWYRHLGFADGTDTWQTTPDPKGCIGEGWNFKHVFSGGNGITYAVNDAGNLLWYRHLGFADGTDRWLTTPEPKGFIGEGWNFKFVFSNSAPVGVIK